MPKYSASGIGEAAAQAADYSAKVDPSKDLAEENKAEWIKRRNKEDRAIKRGLKVLQEWHEIVGTKVLHKVKKNNGGVYSTYVCNAKKRPDIVALLKSEGKLK